MRQEEVENKKMSANLRTICSLDIYPESRELMGVLICKRLRRDCEDM